MIYTGHYMGAMLRGIAAEHPDRVNPVDDERSCVYEDPDESGRHCIIGQFFAVEGLPMPVENGSADGEMVWLEEQLDDVHFTTEAMRTAVAVQRAADNANGDGPLPWGHAIQLARF